MVSVIVAQAHFSWSLPVDELSSQLSSAIMGSGASTEHKSLIEGKTPEARWMQAQVSKFGENKAFTNRNVCLGGRNKPLAAHEIFASCFKTNLFFAGRWQSSGCTKCCQVSAQNTVQENKTLATERFVPGRKTNVSEKPLLPAKNLKQTLPGQGQKLLKQTFLYRV